MTTVETNATKKESTSQSAFVRGFIDDWLPVFLETVQSYMSQSAFVRGFIDDLRNWETVHSR